MEETSELVVEVRVSVRSPRPSIREVTKSTLAVRVPVLEERVSTELVRD